MFLVHDDVIVPWRHSAASRGVLLGVGIEGTPFQVVGDVTHAWIGTQPFLHFLVQRAVGLWVVDAGPGHIPSVCNRERSKPAVRETGTFCSVVNTSLPYSQYTLSRLRGYQQRRPLGILANCSELMGWTENCSYTCFDYSCVFIVHVGMSGTGQFYMQAGR